MLKFIFTLLVDTNDSVSLESISEKNIRSVRHFDFFFEFQLKLQKGNENNEKSRCRGEFRPSVWNSF